MPTLAKALSVSIDDFFTDKEIKAGKSKSFNIWKKLRQVEDLEPDDQKAIINMIDRLVKK